MPNFTKGAMLGLAILVLTSGPAWAVYNQTGFIADPGASDVPISKITFTTPAGIDVPVEEDDDDERAFIIFFPSDLPSRGTLTVEREDGSSVQIAVPQGRPGETVRVDLGTGRAQLVSGGVPEWLNRIDGPADPSWNVSLSGNYASFDLPSVGAGTVIGPNFGEEGNEAFLAVRDGRIGVPIIALDFLYNFGGPDAPRLSGTLAYGWGDDETAASIAPGTQSVGIVYHNFAPSGSTGAFLGASGLDATIDSEISFAKARFLYEFQADIFFGGTSGGPDIRPRVGAMITHIERDVTTSVWSPSFGTSITSDTQQVVEDTNIAISVGLGYRGGPSGGGPGIISGLGADVLAYYYARDLDSLQRNICTVCGSEDQAFDVQISDSDNGVDIGVTGTGYFGYQLDNGLSFGLTGSFLYMNSVGQIDNTRTGDDLFVRNQPTALGESSSFGFSAGLFAAIGF